MTYKNAEKARGIINRKDGDEERFRHARYLPSNNLRLFVEHYWVVSWDLHNEGPFTTELLPHPNVFIVFEKESSRIVGPMTGKFTRQLQGKGEIFGIKIKPGAFYAVINKPISTITNCSIPLQKILGKEILTFEGQILSKRNDHEMIKIVEGFLPKIFQAEDPSSTFVNEITEFIKVNRAVIRVDDILGCFKISKSKLQRLFNQYVGVTPKWVIKRFRLHEAVEQLKNNKNLDLTRLALELGYFDQAHFIRDFKGLVGKPPGEYAKTDT